MIRTSAGLVSILKDLISYESVTEREASLCDALEEVLSSYDGTFVRENDSLMLKLAGEGENNIALVGHIDTVPIGDSTTVAYEKDGSLFGRGACDMKAGLAVMLQILDDLKEGRWKARHNLSFIFYAGEEGPVPNGINDLIDRGHIKDIDFAFILEPTEGRYSVGCLGSLALRKEVIGVSAHSANPRTGVNALDESLRIYQRIGEMDKAIGADAAIDDLPFYETVNVTALNTFNAFNVLPPKAELIINYRFSPERTMAEAQDLLYSYIGKENTEMLDAVESAYAGAAIETFLLQGIEREIMQAWTDMAQLIGVGIPAINYGPGSIKHAHKPDEHIRISELEDFYKKMILHL